MRNAGNIYPNPTPGQYVGCVPLSNTETKRIELLTFSLGNDVRCHCAMSPETNHNKKLKAGGVSDDGVCESHQLSYAWRKLRSECLNKPP